jgi:hypothetical protein
MDDFWPFLQLSDFELMVTELQKQGKLTPLQAIKIQSHYLDLMKEEEEFMRDNYK